VEKPDLNNHFTNELGLAGSSSVVFIQTLNYGRKQLRTASRNDSFSIKWDVKPKLKEWRKRTIEFLMSGIGY